MKINYLILFILLIFSAGCASTKKSAHPHYPQPPEDYLSDCNYLTKEEKAVIYYLNYVRKNPQEFCEGYVKPYIPSFKDDDFDERKASLIALLSSLEANSEPDLQPDETLYELARCLAVKSGELGLTGHDRSQTGCAPLTGVSGECCDYGNATGLEIVLSLLVDAGANNAAMGHRIICLNPRYTKIGVSIQPHIIFKNNAVIDFMM